MEPENLNPNPETTSPAGEVASPSPGASAETEVVQQPTDDQELVAFQAELENAKTPEEKEQARRGYQQRQEARRTRDRERQELEMRAIKAETRAEVLERTSRPPAEATQAQPPEIPAPAMPPRPDPSLWLGIEDYEAREEKKIELLAKWQADCQMVQWKHEREVEQRRTETQRQAEQGQALVNDIIEAHPDFAEKMHLHSPSQAVGESLGILATIDRKAAIETAYHLVNNPAELRRINGMHPEAVRLALGRIAERLSLPPVPSKKVSEAPPPAQQVVSTETTETYDPYNADMETRGRHHPATEGLPWLR